MPKTFSPEGSEPLETKIFIAKLNGDNKAIKALSQQSKLERPKFSQSEMVRLIQLPMSSLSLLPIKYNYYGLQGYQNSRVPIHPQRSSIFTAVDNVNFPFVERLSFTQITAKLDALGLKMKEARVKAESLRRAQPRGGYTPREQKQYAENVFFPFVRDIQIRKIQILAGIPRTIKGTKLAHKVYNKLWLYGDRYLNQWQFALEGKNGRAQLKDPLTQQRSDYVNYNTRLMLQAWKVAYYRKMDSIITEKLKMEGANANLDLIASVLDIGGTFALPLPGGNRYCLYENCSSQFTTELRKQVALGKKFVPGNKLAKSNNNFKPAKNSAQLTVRSFTSTGLNYETELMAIYLGDFENSRLKRNGQGLSGIFSQYIRAYGKYCGAHLPSNKVPITSSKCTTERVTKNGFGAVTNTSCVKWVEVATGLYADPKLYKSSNRISRGASKKMLGNLFSGDPFASRSMVDDVLSVGNDMNTMVQKNRCNNAALKRFENNLYRFVEGKAPILLPSKDTLASARNIEHINFNSDNLNLAKLIDDMIIENSKGWMLHRYISGSVSNIRGIRRSKGGSGSVAGNYAFYSVDKRETEMVTLTFTKDIPACLYFFDAPQTCRHPSRKIINKYEKGGYSY